MILDDGHHSPAAAAQHAHEPDTTALRRARVQHVPQVAGRMVQGPDVGGRIVQGAGLAGGLRQDPRGDHRSPRFSLRASSAARCSALALV